MKTLNPQYSAISCCAGLASLSLALVLMTADAIASDDSPSMEQGIQIGDLAPGRAVVWSRTDRPARMMVAYAFNEQFDDARTVRATVLKIKLIFHD